METISAQSNWRLHCVKHCDHVEVRQAVTCDVHATLPSHLWGLPVTILGNHALRQGWPTPENTSELHLTWGSVDPDAKWDNRNLQSLTLPQHLTHVGDFALCNCRSLHSLTFWDDVADWGSCALMNCHQLQRFFLTRTGEKQGKSLAILARELSYDLDVTLIHPQGDVARLLFPEFEERFEENHLTLKFSYSLAGGGYLYHHIFQDKQLSLRKYDQLFVAYLKKGHDPHMAMVLAFYRLRHPWELAEESAQRYWDYLSTCVSALLCWLVEQRDDTGLSLVLHHLKPTRDDLTQASALSRELQFPQGTALLLAQINTHRPKPPTFSFDL